jgi:hypothetical protein
MFFSRLAQVVFILRAGGQKFTIVIYIRVFVSFFQITQSEYLSVEELHNDVSWILAVPGVTYAVLLDLKGYY